MAATASGAAGSPMASVSGNLASRVEAVGSNSVTVFQTLDEPVSTTIMRDLRMVGTKLQHVLVPTGGNSEDTIQRLKDWDLWGPLLLCLCLSLLLSWGAPVGQVSLVFASVFVLVWAGAAVVTINAQLLGGTMSFFQSVCVLGYCIFPLVLAAVLGALWPNNVFRAILVLVGVGWSSRASVVFMTAMVPPNRRLLALYPVCLFYVVIAWMVYIE